MGPVLPSTCSPRGATVFPGLSRVAALLIMATSVLSVSACSSASTPPIVLLTVQKGVIYCIPAPDPGTSISNWNTPVGGAVAMYYNQSGTPVTVTSVSLLAPHNLLLHGAVLYKMPHYAHPLAPLSAWKDEGRWVPAAEWASRQPIPGAVIPAESGPIPDSQLAASRPDTYQVAVDVSDARPGAGWAPGVVMNYTASGRPYTLTLWAGIAVDSSHIPLQSACHQPTQAIQAAFRAN